MKQKGHISHYSIEEIHRKARAFYLKAFQKLLYYLTFHTQILEDIIFLDPEVRKEANVVEAVRRVAQKLPTVIPPDSIDDVMDEWKLFARDPYVGK